MSSLYNEIRLLLTPAQLEIEELILALKEEAENGDVSAADRSKVLKKLNSLRSVDENLLKSRLELLLVKNALLEIASTKSGKELKTTAISVGWSIDSLVELAAGFNEPLRNNVVTKIVRFRKLLKADDGILATRKSELKGTEVLSQ